MQYPSALLITNLGPGWPPLVGYPLPTTIFHQQDSDSRPYLRELSLVALEPMFVGIWKFI